MTKYQFACLFEVNGAYIAEPALMECLHIFNSANIDFCTYILLSIATKYLLQYLHVRYFAGRPRFLVASQIEEYKQVVR